MAHMLEAVAAACPIAIDILPSSVGYSKSPPSHIGYLVKHTINMYPTRAYHQHVQGQLIIMYISYKGNGHTINMYVSYKGIPSTCTGSVENNVYILKGHTNRYKGRSLPNVGMA